MSEPSKEAEPATIQLTLLLVTGLRVPLKLDTAFITEHEVAVADPGAILIGVLKTALFTSWKDEWGTAPVAAANIRLIHYGKVLEDTQTVEDCKIMSDSPRNVVHMSVKPASFELASTSKPAKAQRHGFRRGTDGQADQAAGSRCCIIS